MHYDVAIIGGGPAGSTTAGMLNKYDPKLRVIVLEREKFPRDHVGESQLPPISVILDELGCWDKVEAANFPIKIGASYRWGRNPELWHFEFFPRDKFRDEPRPAQFAGQRRWTAFQVDRAVYDDILLKHAASTGTDVREQTRISKINTDGDRVTSIEVDTGEKITADFYVDASGRAGVIRKAFGVDIDTPPSLQNIAVWEYWQDAEWANSIGTGGTMVQVLSLGYGWIWFIPISPTRTSIGLVTPADYYKSSGLTYKELYDRALSEEATISKLIENAKSEGVTSTTNDWSFLSQRLCGENWILVGESAGFADPILAAGLTLAQSGAREAAFTILEARLGERSWEWLGEEYERLQFRKINNHIRFANYWYTANAQFSDLQEFTREIAKQNGLELSPEKAWAWLAQGGFINEEMTGGIGGFDLKQVRNISNQLADVTIEKQLDNANVFRLELDEAEASEFARYHEGRVTNCRCFRRDGKILPLLAATDLVVHVLRHDSSRLEINKTLRAIAERYNGNEAFFKYVLAFFENTLEAMVVDGWVSAEHEDGIPMTPFPRTDNVLDWMRDTALT